MLFEYADVISVARFIGGELVIVVFPIRFKDELVVNEAFNTVADVTTVPIFSGPEDDILIGKEFVRRVTCVLLGNSVELCCVRLVDGKTVVGRLGLTIDDKLFSNEVFRRSGNVLLVF